MTDANVTQLPELTDPTDDDLLHAIDDPAGAAADMKITWANLKAMLKTYFDTLYPAAAQVGTINLTNKSGGSVAAGDVVILDGGNDQAFTTTTRESDLRIVGVATEAIAVDASGRIARYGVIAVVNVTGAIARGEWLVTSTTVKLAKSSLSYSKPTDGGLGIALTATAGPGVGTVHAVMLVDTKVGFEAGSLYAVGGYNGSAGIADCDQYTPDTWTSKTDMPAPARSDLTAGVIGSSLYAVGGYSTAAIADCDQYTPDTWTSKTDMPAPARYYLAAGAV